MLFSRLLDPASTGDLVPFVANFSKHLLALCPRRLPRNEENERNNNARRSNFDGMGGSRGKWSVYERGGRTTGTLLVATG